MRSEGIFWKRLMTGALCAINHYQLEYTVTLAILTLGMAYYYQKMTEFFKYTCKAALYSNLQIISEGNGFT